MMLKVLTFNAGLCRIQKLGVVWAHPAPHIEERLAALPAALIATKADVICLQEVFMESHRAFLRAVLAAAGYQDEARLSLHNLWPRDGHGLMIFAKHRLTGGMFYPFKGSALFEGLVTRKGVLTSNLTVLGFGSILLANAHLVSGIHPESPDVQQIRAQQIAQMLDRLDETQWPHILLTADLNAGPHSSVENYRMLAARKYVDSLPEREHYTWDRSNPLTNGPHADMSTQRIDGIFLNARRNGIRVAESRITLNERCVQLPLQHALPLSDHYAVETTFELS
jgi:endonuclease/exonuclease/phosphatase family metal-dependent hydrolase